MLDYTSMTSTPQLHLHFSAFFPLWNQCGVLPVQCWLHSNQTKKLPTFLFAETFEKELSRLQNSGFLLIDGTPVQDLPSHMRSRKVRQVSAPNL